MKESIPLSQKLYLLGIHPEKGGIISASYSAMDYVLLGSLFIELFQNKNVQIENKRIEVINMKTDNDLHLFILTKLKKANRPLRISRAIQKLYFSLKHVRKDVQKELVNRRAIRIQDKKLLFITWKSPVLINKQIVRQLISGIEKQIYSGEASEEELLLLSFLKPARLMKRVFPERDKRKKAKKRLKQMMVENQVSIAVANAISAAQAVAASVAFSAAGASVATS